MSYMPLALPAEGSGITISDLCVLNNPPITLVKMIFVFLLGFFFTIVAAMSSLYNKFITSWTSMFNYNHVHNILRLFDLLPNFPFTTSETMGDYYL